ncbi:MAG: DUF501 domain-containing protein [Acidimicrobiia bacterium]|nr:DUF501 domain-containing protein [Acidimicrobiia bacterium]
MVIRNSPLLVDGRPMPTRFWLVGDATRAAVGRLESAGGVRRAESEVDADELRAAHTRYAAERDRALPPDHRGPRPTGGVGGTRRGVKCLHAHYAWYLAGGDDPVGRWVHARLVEEGLVVSDAVAAIDCGTNSTRLLVTDGAGRPLERLMRITRLGQGVDETRRLAPEAVERTVEVLREYRKVLDEHGVGAVRVTSTSAARDATNRDEFFDAAREVVGVEPELLDGDTEARLSFIGATAEARRRRRSVPGRRHRGGSTEFAFGAAEPERAALDRRGVCADQREVPPR